MAPFHCRVLELGEAGLTQLREQVLRSMGILYDDLDEDVTLESSVAQDLPPRESVPTFRTSSSRRPRRTSRRRQLLLMMTHSEFSNDSDAARYIASSSSGNTTQFNDMTDFTSSQSLPPSSKDPDSYNIPLSSPSPFPTTFNDEEIQDASWTIISTTPSTPISESETWELLGDDS